MSLDNTVAPNHHLSAKLMQVSGVLEVTLNSNSNAAYLKVNRDFNAVEARKVLESG